jgi:hypothetical protein
VSAGAFRVVLRYLYTTELPESGEGGAGAGVGGRKGKGGIGAGGDGGKSKGDEEEATRRQVLEREVLEAADLFRLEALLEHCVEAFRRGLKVDTAAALGVGAQRRASGGAHGGERVLRAEWPAHSGWIRGSMCCAL